MQKSRLPQQSLVYQASAARRKLGIFFGGALSLFGLICAGFLLIRWESLDTSDAGNAMLVGVIGLALGLPMLLASLRERLTLTPDAVEMRSAWKTETMQRSDIAGYRMLGPVGGSGFMFISRHAPSHAVTVEMSFKMDQPFLDWMAGLPDLNLADFNASVREVGAATDTIVAASRASLRLLCTSVAALLWAIVAPEPEWLVVPLNATLPLLALELSRRQPNLYELWELKFNSAKSDLSMALLLPGVALGVIAFQQKASMSWLLCAAGTLALALALSALFGTWRKGRKNLMIGTALLAPYTCALLLVAFGRP